MKTKSVLILSVIIIVILITLITLFTINSSEILRGFNDGLNLK